MPKCASSAIVGELAKVGNVSALGRPELKHTPYIDFERHMLPYLESRLGLGRQDLTVASLFREPIEWLHSWYRYRSRQALADPRHKHHGRYTGSVSFDEFAAGWLSEERPPFARMRSQAEFVTDGNGGVGPDILFRYEDLQSAVDRIGELVGCRIKLRRRNVSPHRTFDVRPDTERALRDSLRRDYEIYESIPPAQA